MASQKQVEANQNNALKSTGPTSVTGLQVVSQNAVKHGFFSTQTLILPGENEEAYIALREQFYDDFQADTKVEQLLVEKMVQAAWKKQRLAMFERRLLSIQQEEQALNTCFKQNAFQEERNIQVLEGEIKALQDEVDSLQGCLETCQKYNRMRPSPKRDEEGAGLQPYVSETLKEARERLVSFLDTIALNDARQTYPKQPEGKYARALIAYSCNFDRDDEEESDCPTHPVYTYGLERIIEIIQERAEVLKTKLALKQQRQALKDSLASIGLDLLPNDENLTRIQRYEAYLDNQFYKALHELQKLQVFLVQKKKAIDV